MAEKCQRCNEEGEDRRTLWMACFYEMNETGMPFTIQKVGERDFYTLRVCKGCRAEWMQFIGLWFKTRRNERLSDDGIYEMTLEEVEETKKHAKGRV